MSVLFKALQKAEKENEQRQTATAGSGFDAGRLAGSGAIRVGGKRGVNWRTAGLAAAVVLAVAIAGAFFLVGAPLSAPPQPAQIVAVTPPPAVTSVPPGTTEVMPVMQPPAAAPPQTTAPAAAPQQVAAAVQPAPVSVPAAPAAAQPAPQPAEPATPAPAPAVAAASAAVPAAPAETEVAAAVPQPAEKPVAAPSAKATASAQPAPPPRKQSMPELAADSPARMLSPPIAIQRAEFELAGVGNQVQVREVSQKAQDNVGAGYNALVNGAYDTSLGFYDRALKDEPTSILALLGRGSALQKLGRSEEAQAAYNQALRIDSSNLEALSNLTVILAERAPAEALVKLLDLEKEYPKFSPVKAQIGLSYAKQGSMELALDYLRRASAMTPDSLMYLYNTALVLDHLNRNEQAVATYERVLASLASGRSAPDLSSTDIERRVRYLKTR